MNNLNSNEKYVETTDEYLNSLREHARQTASAIDKISALQEASRKQSQTEYKMYSFVAMGMLAATCALGIYVNSNHNVTAPVERTMSPSFDTGKIEALRETAKDTKDKNHGLKY